MSRITPDEGIQRASIAAMAEIRALPPRDLSYVSAIQSKSNDLGRDPVGALFVTLWRICELRSHGRNPPACVGLVGFLARVTIAFDLETIRGIAPVAMAEQLRGQQW